MKRFFLFIAAILFLGGCEHIQKGCALVGVEVRVGTASVGASLCDFPGVEPDEAG